MLSGLLSEEVAQGAVGGRGAAGGNGAAAAATTTALGLAAGRPPGDDSACNERQDGQEPANRGLPGSAQMGSSRAALRPFLPLATSSRHP